VGGDAGLFHFHGGAFQRYAPPGGHPYERVLSLYRSHDGALWIAVEGHGLDRLRDGVLTTFGPSRGMPATEIASILEDGEGRLWLGTERQGLLSISTASFDAVVSGRQAGLDVLWLKKEDGLATNQFRGGHQPAAWRGKGGMLWFATLKGLVMVDPTRVTRNLAVPPVRIESVGINGRRIAIDPDATGSQTVPAGSRRLEFFYTALSFTAPERVRFQYLLEGLDTTLLDAAERSASFGDLRPGDYVFRVRAANNDGV
jgi:hypothetical protein